MSESATAAATPTIPPEAGAGAFASEIRIDPLRRAVSVAALFAAGALLAGTFLLLSPREGQTYPGAIPWRSGSLLKPIIDLMSLRGLGDPQTSRGVEIKDLVFHLASAVGLALFAVRAAVAGVRPRSSPTRQWAWLLGQAFLGAWVLLSLASAGWSTDSSLALGQGILYALALGWAISLAWTLDWREIPRLLAVYITIAVVGAVLCIWYYHERNPAHRPGFPIGNPSTLAAAIVPAFVLAVWSAATRAWELVKTGRGETLRLVLSCAAMIPLAWCLLLTNSRGALVALAAAGATIALLQTRGQARAVVLAGCIFALAGGIWYVNAGANNTDMARGGSLRFRLYAWSYAARMWGDGQIGRPISGHGAGCYPRLATQLAAPDRQLDPAAFMAANVEHAHNELFEVLAEIGLIGGLTFVGGYVATGVAAVVLLSSIRDRRRRLSLVGLCAGLAALLADSMVGVGLRLPGVPAVHYTLLGMLWAACYSLRREEAENGAAGASAAAGPAAQGESAVAGRPPKDASAEGRSEQSPDVVLRYALAAGGGLAAVLAAWAGVWNWSGALAEPRAAAAMDRQAFSEARDYAAAAESQLLDPFRRLVAAEVTLTARFAIAYAAMVALQNAEHAEPPRTSAELAERRSTALERAQEVHDHAVVMEQRAPSFGRVSLLGARSAEMIANLIGPVDRAEGQRWRQIAWVWYRERLRLRPTEAETLLALFPYEVTPANPEAARSALDLLRAALREPTPTGLPSNEWFELLQRSASIPRIDEAVNTMMQMIGPFTPQTDMDTLAATFAPETRRLLAYMHSLSDDYDKAIQEVSVAAEMYRRMRARFPEMYSVALGEKADMVFLSDPTRPEEAIRLAEQGIAELPLIQEQKLETLLTGRRMRLAQYLLAAGREEQAFAELRKIRDDEARVRAAIATLYLDLAQRFLGAPPSQRPPVMAWVQASLALAPAEPRAWRMKAWLRAELGGPEALVETLKEAQAAGLDEEELRHINAFVVQSFAPPETQPATQTAPSTGSAPAARVARPASGTPASRPTASQPVSRPAASQPATRPRP